MFWVVVGCCSVKLLVAATLVMGMVVEGICAVGSLNRIPLLLAVAADSEAGEAGEAGKTPTEEEAGDYCETSREGAVTHIIHSIHTVCGGGRGGG